MGLFFTRIDRTETHHQHNETYEKTTTHVKAPSDKTHDTLREFKEEARKVIDKELEVENTVFENQNTLTETFYNGWSRDVELGVKFKINGKEVRMLDNVPEDRFYCTPRDGVQVVLDVVNELLPKYLLKEKDNSSQI
jgi:hypothetical protein